MSDLTMPEVQPTNNRGLIVEYLLQELEFQVAIETRARDRMENMVQYLLTTVAAVIGAALLVNEMQVSSILILFIASLLMFVFSTTAFYRSCRLRYITTYARVTRNNIRCALRKLGIPEADQLIEWEGNPSGFCKLMLNKLIWLMFLCILLGGVTGISALMLIIFLINRWPIFLSGSELAMLIVVPLGLMVVIGIVLGMVLKSQKSKSDQLITDPDWRNLPDYDM
jgi:hypothetical protein